ncbi:MAG: aminoacyl-tRNA hydrolase [Bacteroidia bacterium]|nr:aminoacyl-tRNA hydrolase [Bacteroidia bacterium]
MKYLVTALGNPGIEYVKTRHNIGFLIADAMADKYDVQFEQARHSYKTLIKYKGKQLHVIKPTTYMNLSGKAINYWLQQLKIPLSNLIVILDDLSLPLGKIRVRSKGGDGGHNGLKSIAQYLGADKYARMRFGIGDEFGRGQQVDHVLGEWTDEEYETVQSKLNIAIEIVENFVTNGVDSTMNKYNNS